MSHIARLAADIHLSPDSPERTRRFLDFLESCRAQQHTLFLLGDVFDVWYGDDDPSDFANEIKTALREVTAAGCPVFIQHGNRDFMLGRKFMQQTRCTLLPDEYALVWDNRRYLLMHGDSLVADPFYVKSRRSFRLALTLLGQILPFASKQQLAHYLRRKSRGSDGISHLDMHRVTAALHRNHCATLIHGHTHQQGSRTHEDGGESFTIYTLSDWTQDEVSYLQLQNGEARFVSVP